METRLYGGIILTRSEGVKIRIKLLDCGYSLTRLTIDKLFWFRLTRVVELSFSFKNNCFVTKNYVIYNSFGVSTLGVDCLDTGD